MTRYKRALDRVVPPVTREILASWEKFKREYPGIATVLVYTDGFTNTRWAEDLIKTELWPDGRASYPLFVDYIRKGGEFRQFGEANYFDTHAYPCVSRWADEMLSFKGLTYVTYPECTAKMAVCPQLATMFIRGLTDPEMSRAVELETTYCEMRDMPPKLQ